MEYYHDIYDRIAKRCISLSSRCTVNLINGIYGTCYPTDSAVTYNWTEHTDNELKRTLADTIITINHQHSYHLEFQMTSDGDILLRMFDYGFHHAKNQMTADTITFPEPVIICLYDQANFPDEYTLNISFGTQGSIAYRIPVYKYLQKSLAELDEKRMIALIPFQLLRLRKSIEKERTKENMDALKKLITHDILDSLNHNVEAGNLSQTESMKLRRMILFLYHHIYDRYDELEKEGVNQVAEEALIFDVDILDYKIRQLEEQTRTLEAQQQALEKTRQSLEEANQSLEQANQSLEQTNQSLETDNFVLRLLASGLSIEAAAERSGLSPEKIREILNF